MELPQPRVSVLQEFKVQMRIEFMGQELGDEAEMLGWSN